MVGPSACVSNRCLQTCCRSAKDRSYPALHKLEQEGWIEAEWKQSENNRRAKFYSLTRLGTKQLESETANWRRLSSAISHVVQFAEA